MKGGMAPPVGGTIEKLSHRIYVLVTIGSTKFNGCNAVAPRSTICLLPPLNLTS